MMASEPVTAVDSVTTADHANLQRVRQSLQRNVVSVLNGAEYPTDPQHYDTESEVLDELLGALKPATVFELGSWKGHSAIAIANRLKSFHPQYAVVCIDTWLGHLEHHLDGRLFAEMHVHNGRPTLWERFVGNVAQSQAASNIYFFHGTTSIAHDVFLMLQCRADFIYLNGGKRFKDVYDDLHHANDLLTEKGVIAGTSFLHPPVRNAVMQFALEHSYQVAIRGSKWIYLRNSLSPTPSPSWRRLIPVTKAVARSGEGDREPQEIAIAYAPKENLNPKQKIIPLYPGQPNTRLQMMLDAMALPEKLSLRQCTIKDGYFLIRPGCDGVVFDEKGRPVDSTAPFIDPSHLPSPEDVRRLAGRLQANVFLGVDCHWHNYFHWIVLAITRMLIARRYCSEFPQYKCAVPDYASAQAAGQRISFSHRVWQQSFSITGNQSELLPLIPGIYQAPYVSFLATNSSQAAALTLFSEANDAWNDFRKLIPIDNTSPKKICVMRRDLNRLSEAESNAIVTIAQRHGYVCGFLEDLDFGQQAKLYANANSIVAPHGAGLSNLLFAQKGARVVEINRILPGDAGLRPWFYMLAVQRGMHYQFADLSSGEWNAEMIAAAFQSN